MKRRIFTFLLAAALVLLTACSGRGTEPPVRIGEAIGEASLLRSYSAAEAFQEADAVALVRVGDWLGEQDGGISHHLLQGRRGEILQGRSAPGVYLDAERRVRRDL